MFADEHNVTNNGIEHDLINFIWKNYVSADIMKFSYINLIYTFNITKNKNMMEKQQLLIIF